MPATGTIMGCSDYSWTDVLAMFSQLNTVSDRGQRILRDKGAYVRSTLGVTMMLYPRPVNKIWRSSDVKAASTKVLESIDISTGSSCVILYVAKSMTVQCHCS